MRKFKTESQKLLDMMINSIYTNKEIFLRELISNASDAIDKLYFQSLTDTSIQLTKDELAIDIAFDKASRTLSIKDSGIGMDKDELETNLGTIAHSGSQEFAAANLADKPTASTDAAVSTDDASSSDTDKSSGSGKPTDDELSHETEESATSKNAIDIIGQFGVGFYSAFMVASKVRVISKRYGDDDAWVWESDGVEGYTIEPGQKDSHGTEVILTIKDGSVDDESYDSYLTESGLKRLIRKYSNYIRYPIRMECAKTRQLPKPDDAPEDYKPQYEHYTELETINSMIPIWKRRRADVSQEEYDDFYKNDFHDFANPVRTVSIHAEGLLSYDALLFVPSRAPYDLYSKDYKKGLALYSSGVMIMEKCEDLLPDCFNFVKGVVDSEDLKLNVSRETLQKNSQLRAIERMIEKKVKADLLDMLEKDREGYEKMFDSFGRGMKYSIYASYGSQASLLSDLLLFHSAREDKLVTLKEYVDAAPDDSKSIFYAVGDTTERLAKMPIVGSVLAKGYDVLLCTQDVDEFCLQAMQQFEERTFKNVTGGDLGLETEAERETIKAASEESQDLLAAMTAALDGKVTKTVVSTRLTDAPACITAEGPISLEMEQQLSGYPDEEELKSERVLEINPENPIFTTLKNMQALGAADKIKTYTKILYDQALLIQGLPIDDPVEFAQEVCKLMK